MARRKLIASTTSRVDRPNFERSPPDASQRPDPLAASLTRMPMRGRTPIFLAVSAMSASSENFSTTIRTVRPSFDAISAVSMYSSSL